MKNFLLLTIIFIFSLFLPVQAQDILPAEYGVVKNIMYIENSTFENQMIQKVDVQLTSGKYKGEILELENVLTGNPLYDINLEKGKKVILHVEDNGEGLEFDIQDIKRSDSLIALSCLFLLMLVLVGKKQGLLSFISIVFTLGLLMYFLCPFILKGANPIFLALIVSLLATVITIYLVGGFNAKSSSAVFGTMLSLFFAVILSLIISKTASLSGFTGEVSMYLFTMKPNIDFVSIIIAIIILSTLGAVMDVAMSIASTINEIYLTDKNLSIKELFVSGMNVGRDIIGTMANTLILVYLGGALPLLLISNSVDFIKFINLNPIVTEISAALIGSISIIACVPITAIISACMTTKYYKETFEMLDCK